MHLLASKLPQYFILLPRVVLCDQQQTQYFATKSALERYLQDFAWPATTDFVYVTTTGIKRDKKKLYRLLYHHILHF